MGRIRTIKPAFWDSEALGTRLPGSDGRQARLLFIALWNHAEDHGVCRASPVLLRAATFAYDEDVTSADVARWLGMLEAGGFIVRYERGGSSYLWIRSFDEHQRIDRKSKTTLPEPSLDEIERRASPHRALALAVAPSIEPSRVTKEQENTNDFPASSPRRALDEPSLPEGKGREGSGKEEDSFAATADAAPPAAEPFALTGEEAAPPKKQRTPRKPSAAEELYRRIQEAREARCKAAGVHCVPDRWDNARQNKSLREVVQVREGEPLDADGRTETQANFDAAFAAYLGDERHRDKGWPLSLFIHGEVRSRYEQQALMGGAA